MLVLTRQRDEAIIIDHPAGPIEITVVDIRGDKVRLGFDADRSIRINRKEILEENHERSHRRAGRKGR